MLIGKRKGWEIPERLATPEHIALNRRAFLATGVAAGAVAASAGPAQAFSLFGSETQTEGDVIASLEATRSDPTFGLYPVKRNEAFKLDRGLTPELINAGHNNFYEFNGGGTYFPGKEKQVVRTAQKLKTRPWTVTIDGLVEKPFEIGIDELIRKMPLEERLYRLRCVEAWSMTIPWTGFPVAELVKLAKPLSSAKYLRMETFLDPDVAPGQTDPSYSWPYVEGLSMAEATNDLALIVTGAYGKPLANQFGAPIRLHAPWKYGFKSVKSITRFTFTEERPRSLWETASPSEYGFWANVNPQVPHRRWSQAVERILGTGDRVPTLLYNGYGEWVAGIYASMQDEPLFM